MLPSTKRVEVSPERSLKKIWIYGQPFSGKTTFADQSPTPINLNTDGNVKYVTMPRLEIKDQVKVEGSAGRERSVRTHAWAVFKNAIDELERGSDFETIVVDLVEDTYEQCRLFMYDKLNIDHESDDAFRAWDKVRIEFLSTYRRLLNLDYNIILISHEDTSKDITKKTGDKITAIKPNITDKIANKLAGMVDIVARVVVESDDYRVLSFKQNEVIFGGGRLKGIKTSEVPLNWEALMGVYDGISATQSVSNTSKANNTPKEEKPSRSQRTRTSKVEETPEVVEVVETVEVVEEPRVEEKPRRSRRIGEVANEQATEYEKTKMTENKVEESSVESPKRERTRRQSVEKAPSTPVEEVQLQPTRRVRKERN